MISCTEFIPAYSTMFTYLEEKYGPQLPAVFVLVLRLLPPEVWAKRR